MRRKGNILYDVVDSLTGEFISYVVTTTGYDGTTITSNNESEYVDSVLWIKFGTDQYAKRVVNTAIDIRSYGVTGDGATNDYTNFVLAITFASKADVPIIINKGTNIRLVGTVNFPENTRLIFNGGTITTGTLNGNETIIQAPIKKIFNTDVILQGTFSMDYICPQHFGAKTNSSQSIFENDCSAQIQKCIDSPLTVKLPQGFYYVSSPVYITKAKEIKLEGRTSPTSTNQDHARIYTDQNTDLVFIQSRDVYIRGGAIDVTKCSSYSSNIITYDTTYPIWGGEIDTLLSGERLTTLQVGKGGTGIYIKINGVNQTGGYAVFLTFKGYYTYLHTGIKVDDRDNTYGIYCNSIKCDADMNGMKKFIDSGTQVFNNSVITGRYQEDFTVLVDVTEKAYSCVKLDCTSTYVDISIADVSVDRPSGSLFIINEFAADKENTIGPRTQYFYDRKNITGKVYGMLNTGGFWNNPWLLGDYYFWVDGTGRYRVKSSAPSSETDGTIVGTQS